MRETRFSRNVRVVVGAILVAESVAVLVLGVFTAMIGGLVGALAFLVGGGSASNEKIAQGFAVLAISLASPFVVGAVLAVGATFVLLRRRRLLIISVGIFAITAHLAFHVFTAEGFHAKELVPCAVHLLTIAVGVAFVPDPAANATSA